MAEDEIERLNDLLRKNSELINNISAEIRTPLTSIQGYSSLLLEGMAGTLNDRQTVWVKYIRDNAGKLMRIIDTTLILHRLDTDNYPIRERDVDVNEIIKTVLSAFSTQPKHREHSWKISSNLTPNLPLLRTDDAALERILSELIDNAMQYTPDNGAIEIGTRVAYEDNRILLYVKDTGIGIGQNFADSVWVPFVRLGLRNRPESIGAGLAIVKQLVDLLHGKVWFESEVDKGTTFYVELPLAQA